MIDLHIHSKYSNGTDSIKEILEKAESKQLNYISITDHNTVEGYREILEHRHLFSGKIIPGAEMATYYQNELIDILAYGFDIDKMKKQIKRHVLNFDKRRIKEQKQLTKHFKKLGFTIGNIKYISDQEISLRAFYRELIKHPENLSYFDEELTFKIFVRNHLFNSNSELFVDFSKSFPSLKKMVKMIHDAGGLVFVAHPFLYHIDVVKSLDDMFKNYDIDGVECFHSTFSDRQIDALIEFANEKNLYKSGGSDYHEPIKDNPNLKIGGGDLRISLALISPWVNNINLI